MDILFYGDEILEEEGLQIPHPRLHERKFVLTPLQDLAPHREHPLLRKTVSQMVSELKADEKVFPISEESNKTCTG